MKCPYQLKDWIQYTKEELDEKETERMEEHLLSCSACLSLYEQAIQQNSEQLKEVHGPVPDMTENIMAVLCKDTSFLSRQDHSFGYSNETEMPAVSARSTFLHYAVAASFAFVLYSVGVFDHIVHAMGQTETVTKQADSWMKNLSFNPQEWWKVLRDWLIIKD